MDWNDDGVRDIVSGDHQGYFNVFTDRGGRLVPHTKVRLADGETLDVGLNSIPFVADWNMDGRKDLLFGTDSGFIRVYLNQGTDTSPAFQDFSQIQFRGQPLRLTRSHPALVDLDHDGVRNLVCGSLDGRVRFYRNTGSDGDPVFNTVETLKTVSGGFVIPPGTVSQSRIGICDWNDDRVPDILISGPSGMIDLYLGQSGASGMEDARRTTHDAQRAAELRVTPNPATASVTITSGLVHSGDEAISIYDSRGRLVKKLHAANCGQWNQVVWNRTDDSGKLTPPGVYLIRTDRGDQFKLVTSGRP